MYDLTFYQLLVDIRSFADVKDSVAEYITSPKHLDIATLFRDLTSGRDNYGSMNMQQALTYFNSAASDICAGYDVDENEVPIYQAYLFPYDFGTTTDAEVNELIEMYENAISVAVNDDNPAWYLREDLKNRLMTLYHQAGNIEELRAIVADAKVGRERYDTWLTKAR